VRGRRDLPEAVRRQRRHADAWPMQHPELAVLIWSVAPIAGFVPTAVYLDRRKVLR